HVDIDAASPALIEELRAELEVTGFPSLVAWRQGQRWAPRLEPRPLAPGREPAVRLRERGVYLITGGLGSMGLALAGELVRAARARLVLLGRSAPTPAQQRAVADLTAAGAEVLVLRADVADPAALSAALSQARE